MHNLTFSRPQLFHRIMARLMFGAASNSSCRAELSGDVLATCSSAQQPASSCRSGEKSVTDWLMHSMDFHSLYESARYAMVSKTWKRAVDNWRSQIKRIDYFNCSAVNDAMLNVVAKSCPGLKTLDLGSCPNHPAYQPRSVKVTAAALEAVAKGCRRLENINLSAGFQMITDKNMDDQVLPFVKYCPQLSFLDLSECRIGDRVLQALAIKSRLLKHLDLNGCGKEITNAGILMVAEACRKLKFLNISDSNCSALALQAGFPELRYLDVSSCFMERMDVLTAVMRGCPKLEQLKGDHEEVDADTEATMESLRRKMPQLQLTWV